MNDGQARLDARNLRGIAHPLRIKILGMLRADGPSTSTTIALRLGTNTGATSYHLRQLAAYGFVVEDTGTGSRRERWWRAAQENTVLPDETLARDNTGLGAAFVRAVAQTQADNVLRAAEALPTLPEAWRRVLTLNDYLLTLTASQAARLAGELHDVVQGYRAAGPEQDGNPAKVTVQLLLFPTTGGDEARG